MFFCLESGYIYFLLSRVGIYFFSHISSFRSFNHQLVKVHALSSDNLRDEVIRSFPLEGASPVNLRVLCDLEFMSFHDYTSLGLLENYVFYFI